MSINTDVLDRCAQVGQTCFLVRNKVDLACEDLENEQSADEIAAVRAEIDADVTKQVRARWPATELFVVSARGWNRGYSHFDEHRLGAAITDFTE
eukprot:m.72927 g.72927  ORF g.72927 m.72927 type:complete len:95 (+) comp50260_c1_seq1:501-785(+)